ncbi:MAG: hypothetical protein KDD35_11670, partial [Bdellovibrionales bacterium]|nr:hypothetical protein [Bdellovibrionales bacterium]
YILYPLPFLGWMTWLVLCLILFSLSLLARTTTILRSVSGYLSGGVEQKTNRFGEASLWLGYMGTGLILSFLMLMWGSASLAQVLGASLVCLGIFLITIWLIDDSFFFHSLDWLWVFFFWEGVGAYFYLEVPAQFLIPMALPMGLGQMWRAHFRGRANSRHLIILCFVVTAIVLAVGGWAFMSKPKSFY